MKKLLLSALAVFGLAMAANAEAKTEDFTTANEWWGVSAKGDCTGDVKTATSATTGTVYTYTYTYASKGNGIIIQGSDNTPSGVTVGGYVTFKLDIACAQITLKTGKTASTAAVVNVYAGETLIKENLALNAQDTDFTIAVPEANRAAGTVYKIDNISKKNAQFQSATFSTEAGSVTPDPVDPTPDPVDPTDATFSKVNTLTTGKYAMVVMEEGTSKLVRPYIGTASYGRWNVIEITLADNTLTTAADNAFTITVGADGKATVQDETGRYYGMDDSHFTSFQFYTEVNDGCYWTVTFEGDNAKFTNALNPTCIICQSKGNQGTWYTNVAPANAPAEFNLPILFKQTTSAIEAVETEATDAPVVYYNLQGVQVANPEKGLYIRVQGKKAEKVVL